MSGDKLRLAIVNFDKCKPKKCRQECKRICPVERTGKICIDIENIAVISENMCIGCGMCAKACPFGAVTIINLPSSICNEIIFRYGANSFQLNRLPHPRENSIVGLVGENGIGKSTIFRILTGKALPNFGKYGSVSSKEEIVTHFRGSSLQSYFEKLYSGQLTHSVKPQQPESIAKDPVLSKKTVREVLSKYPSADKYTRYIIDFDLTNILDSKIGVLSGGEIQRLAICVCLLKDANVYLLDEPSNFLDVEQRIKMSKVVRALVEDESRKKYIFVIEHDLIILGYLSDYIHCMYGSASHYGVVSLPYTTAEGINEYMEGFLTPENVRFRDHGLQFVRTDDELDADEEKAILAQQPDIVYDDMKIQFESVSGANPSGFTLNIKAGGFSKSQVVCLLGRNGTGKSTFLKAWAGLIKVDGIPELHVSYKAQHVSPKFEGTVKELLQTKIGGMFSNKLFESDVLKLLRIPELFDCNVLTLSGGEIQRVAITLALGKPADLYLLDEPSACLDVEQRMLASKCIKRFARHFRKMVWIVEHDIMMATYVSDKIIVFEGVPSKDCVASSPSGPDEGMNKFLKQLDVTVRQNRKTLRPRINKPGGVKDREQKAKGVYFANE